MKVSVALCPSALEPGQPPELFSSSLSVPVFLWCPSPLPALGWSREALREMQGQGGQELPTGVENSQEPSQVQDCLSMCPGQPHTAPAAGDLEIPAAWPFLQLCKYRDLLGCEALLTGTLEFLLHPSPLPHGIGYSLSVEKYNATEMQPRVLIPAGASFP